MAAKVEGWQRDKDGDLILRSSAESNVNSMQLGAIQIPCELIDDLIVAMKKHAGSEGDNEAFVVGGYDAKPALGERSEPALPLLGEAATIIKDMVDGDECSLDHHGFCQAHGFLIPGRQCPHARAKEFLRQGGFA